MDFCGGPIHILSAEDFMTYKANFDRKKDWKDVATILYVCDQPLDYDYVHKWLARIGGPKKRGSRG